jgi:hypothetical protein
VNEIVHLDDETIIKMFKKEYMTKRLPGDFMYIFFNENIPIQGHKGDIHGTFHEWLFSLLFPTLKKQVSFGTGKGGLKKWLCKCYTADFVDEEDKYIFEIDGKSHNYGIHHLKDKLRDIFFTEKGYKIVRLSNAEVENMLVKRYRRIYGRTASN